MIKGKGRPQHIRLISGSLMILGLAGISLLAFDAWISAHDTSAVVLADGAIAYSGPSSRSYPQAYANPLGAGTELTILEQRDGWSLFKLTNNSEGWIPTDSIALVNEHQQ